MGYPNKPVQRHNNSCDLLLLFILHLCLILYAYFIYENGFFILSLLVLIGKLTFIVLRIVLCLREFIMWRHLYSSLSELILRCVKMEHWPTFLIPFAIYFSMFLLNVGKSEHRVEDILTGKHYSILDFMIFCLPVIVVGLCLEWSHSPLTESYKLERSYSFSGGSGMAFGFYYGYLKLILPKLLDSLNNFLSKENVKDTKMPYKKLFILIPSSTFIFNRLQNTGKEQIGAVEDKLEITLEQDRGMVLKRVYKNTLYKLKDKNNKEDKEVTCYVPLEGATPLLTFNETCNHEPQLKAFKKEVIASFYYTLETLLSQDREVRGLAELVYYDDEKNPEIMISDVIRERIRYLNKLENRQRNVKH